MKIISANRSDVFNEYISIISRYNEKNLVKEAGALGEAYQDIIGLAMGRSGSIGGDLIDPTTEAIAKVTTRELTAAGVDDLGQVSRIWKNIQKIQNTFGNDNIKFIVKDYDGWRLPDAAEIDQAKNWSRRNGTNTIQGKAFPDSSIIGIQNATDNTIFNAGKLLDDGINFASDTQRAEFASLSQRLASNTYPMAPLPAGSRIPNPAVPGPASAASNAARPAAPAASVPGSAAASFPGDYARSSDLYNLGQNLRAGIGKGIGNTIAEINKLKATLLKALLDGNDALANRLIAKIDDSYKDLSNLLKKEISDMRQSYETTLNNLQQQMEKVIVDGDDRIIKELGDRIKGLETQFTTASKTIDDRLNTITDLIKANAEAAAKSNAEQSSILAAQADQLTEMKRALDDTNDQLKNIKGNTAAAGAATTAATTAVGAATKVAKLKAAYGYLITALKIAGVLGAAYLLYQWYTGYGSDDDEQGGTPIPGNEDPRAGGGGAIKPGAIRPSTSGGSDGEGDLAKYLENPNERMALFDEIDRMSSEEADEILNRIARYYGAVTYLKLDTPVVVSNELITYVFPSKRRAGRVTPTRLGATKEYFSDVYSNPGKKNYGLLISRLRDESGESDSQKIANHSFSSMAAGGMFSGEGTFFGNRGERYGKGKSIKSVSEKGLASGGKRRLTRKEKEIARQQALEESVVAEADDFLSDNNEDYLYDEIDDPMQAFASGQDEFFNKKSKNINISTNKTNSYEFAKKADKISNRYFKDAVEDLQDDEFMKAYYAGFSKLHNQKPKKQKPDYEKLYDLHDETGAELIHKAHPKAISVAEAIGKGGLVENGSERSKAMEDIAFRVPSGNYRARYAFIQEALKKKS